MTLLNDQLDAIAKALESAMRQWESYYSERNSEDLADADHSEADAFRRCEAALAILKKYLSAYEAGRGMFPMKTAPRDGSEVLLQVELRAGIPGKFLVGHWMPGGHCIEDHPAIDEGWYFWNGCQFDKAAKPIGRQPLPSAPGSLTETKG